MTTFVFANNVNTTLAGNVSTTATTLTLASAANLPASIPSGFVMALTLNDSATRNNYEIVYVTAITGATLTVLRAQEGTPARAWLVGDFAYSGPTAGQQASFAETSGNNTWTGNNTFNNPVVVPNATATGDALNLGQAEAYFAALNGSASQPFNVEQATTPTEAMPLGQLPSQFPSSLTGNGYKKYPDSNSPTGYFIEQWGSVILGNGPNQPVTLPIAFPNAFLSATCSYGASTGPNQACGADRGSLSTILIGNATTSATNLIYYLARGY
jgi:hypothetical protein